MFIQIQTPAIVNQTNNIYVQWTPILWYGKGTAKWYRLNQDIIVSKLLIYYERFGDKATKIVFLCTGIWSFFLVPSNNDTCIVWISSNCNEPNEWQILYARTETQLVTLQSLWSVALGHLKNIPVYHQKPSKIQWGRSLLFFLLVGELYSLIIYSSTESGVTRLFHHHILSSACPNLKTKKKVYKRKRLFHVSFFHNKLFKTLWVIHKI